MAAKSKPQAAAGYTVLARRYRSRDFDELIGQEPIARTLQNAIKTNRVAHAYLFCGTRGVGKTSMARIFAKALNATDDLTEKEAVGDAILRGDDLDVIEIDAASNRGIDSARDLIGGAGLSPTRSPYKVYIIDEVHMLTQPAFNALLKTMEEPPAHVKFILCTTEAMKVPATIQSRCQRFDFRPIPSARIADQLKMILKKEGIKADDEVISHVARLGNGSMRDALSLMDRLLASGEEKLTPKLVEEMLGLPDHLLVTNLVDAFIAGDAKQALQRGAELLNSGASIEQSLELLTEHLRTLMIVAACGDDAEFLDLSEEHRKIAQEQASQFDAAGLVHMIALCDAVARNSKWSAAARSLFDAAMVRLAMSERFADIPQLLNGQGPPASRGQLASATVEAKKKEVLVSAPPVIGEVAEVRGQRSEISPPISSAPQSALEIKPFPDVDEPIPGERLWARVLEVASASMGDRHRTAHLVYQSFDGQTLKLGIDDGGADIVRHLKDNSSKITDLVKRATGKSLRIDLDFGRFEGSTNGTTETATPSAQTSRPPLVQTAIDLFDATVVDVQPLT